MNQYRKTGQPEQARHLPMLLSSVKVDLREPAKGPLMRWIVLVLALWPLPAPADETGDALAFVLEHSGYEDIVLVRLPGGLFATEVRVNGQRGLFMIDSGASQTVLDADRARLYPLGPVLGRQEVTGALGTLAVQRRQVQVLGIGALSETRTLIHVADLSHITRAIAAQGGPVVDGVIGQDLLLHHSAVLDMARGRMFLRDGAE